MSLGGPAGKSMVMFLNGPTQTVEISDRTKLVSKTTLSYPNLNGPRFNEARAILLITLVKAVLNEDPIYPLASPQ